MNRLAAAGWLGLLSAPAAGLEAAPVCIFPSGAGSNHKFDFKSEGYRSFVVSHKRRFLIFDLTLHTYVDPLDVEPWMSLTTWSVVLFDPSRNISGAFSVSGTWLRRQEEVW